MTQYQPEPEDEGAEQAFPGSHSCEKKMVACRIEHNARSQQIWEDEYPARE